MTNGNQVENYNKVHKVHQSRYEFNCAYMSY